MSKFEKRNTIVKLEIMGNSYEADFGRDEVPAILIKLSQDIEKEEKKRKEETDSLEKVTQNEKALFKKAINEILQNENASGEIFKDDDSSILHADVYGYIVDEYYNFTSAAIEKYAPGRAQRRAK